MMIQGSITEAFAVQDGKEKEGNFATSMPTAPIAEGHLVGRGTIPPPSLSLTSPLAMPQHVLSRWPWVSKDTIKIIALENFDIDNLLKFHRFDELRNAYLKRSMKDIYQSLNDDSAELVIDISKLHFSFKNSTMFFLA